MLTNFFWFFFSIILRMDFSTYHKNSSSILPMLSIVPQDEMSFPKLTNKYSFKQIGLYLQCTDDEKLVIQNIQGTPENWYLCILIKLDNAMGDPICIRAGLVLNFLVAKCHIMWQSRLQSQNASSNIEAEFIAIAHSCCKMCFILDWFSIIGKAVGLVIGNTIMQVSIHQDCVGALVLAKTLLF